MSICTPEVDWSCLFTEADLVDMRANPVEAAALERSEAYGWALLASLTAYRIAVCPAAVRPCAARCLDGGGMLTFPVSGGAAGALGGNAGAFSPHISGGKWFNSCGCRKSGDCSCAALSEVLLPGPVGGVVSVVVDGITLPPTSYRVDNGNRLVRLNGEQWPACQDQSLPANAVGAFVVTYYRGSAPSTMTKHAAGLLAAEFYQACAGSDCRLPDNVTSIARQGVSYELEPSDFPDGVTGIRAVDALIRIYNPHKRKGVTRIASPDAPIARVTTVSR